MRVILPALAMLIGLPWLVLTGQPFLLGLGVVLMVWWWRSRWMVPMIIWLALGWDALMLDLLGSRGGILVLVWLALFWLPATPLVAFLVLTLWLGLGLVIGWFLPSAAVVAIVLWGVWLLAQWGVKQWQR